MLAATGYLTVSGKSKTLGFTLIELLVVMAIIATLLSIAVPRYMRSIDDAKEATLKSSLSQMREAIDHYYADLGSYPVNLTDLIEKRYLRSIPVDPMTESAQTWTLIPPPLKSDANRLDSNKQDLVTIYDVRSGAVGMSRKGEPYANW